MELSVNNRSIKMLKTTGKILFFNLIILSKLELGSYSFARK